VEKSGVKLRVRTPRSLPVKGVNPDGGGERLNGVSRVGREPANPERGWNWFERLWVDDAGYAPNEGGCTGDGGAPKAGIALSMLVKGPVKGRTGKVLKPGRVARGAGADGMGASAADSDGAD
jgi:hypothetical protein